MFPLDPAFSQHWETGPQGAQPSATPPVTAAVQMALPTDVAREFGHLDALAGKDPRHQSQFPFSRQAHGHYLKSYNKTRGSNDARSGRKPMSKNEYASKTGRPDLHSHYWNNYWDAKGQADNEMDGMLKAAAKSASRCSCGRKMASGGCRACGKSTGCECLPKKSASLQRQADFMTRPHQSTDDVNPPFNSAATTPSPESQNMSPQAPEASAGFRAGQEDARAGRRPTFADNSSGVSPYVQGYAQGFASVQPERAPDSGGHPGAAPPSPDVPRSMGGDSGQAQNSAEAERAFMTSKASLAPREASLRISAAFASGDITADPEFRKGYAYAARWKPGQRLVSQGSAALEAGVYAGITDRPSVQRDWVAEHVKLAARHPVLASRLERHQTFTAKLTQNGMGVQSNGFYPAKTAVAGGNKTAAVTTDLITDGPGSSPDPMGSTPINGPGTPPPMGGLSDPAAPGGAPPYQGAFPPASPPVVPDDVMGKPQEPPQPSGPFTQTFSGTHPENADLAPASPNAAAGAGYSNPKAYDGDPRGGDKVARLAVFRANVQAGLSKRSQNGYAHV